MSRILSCSVIQGDELLTTLNLPVSICLMDGADIEFVKEPAIEALCRFLLFRKAANLSETWLFSRAV